MKALLDAQEAYLYVVDMQSRELLYLNRKAREMDPLVRTGNTCHQAFLAARRLAHIVRFVSRSLRNAIFRSIICG